MNQPENPVRITVPKHRAEGVYALAISRDLAPYWAEDTDTQPKDLVTLEIEGNAAAVKEFAAAAHEAYGWLFSSLPRFLTQPTE